MRILLTFTGILFTANLAFADTCNDLKGYIQTLQQNPKSLTGQLKKEDSDGKEFVASRQMPDSLMCSTTYSEYDVEYQCIWTFMDFERSRQQFVSLYNDIKSCPFIVAEPDFNPHQEYESWAAFDSKLSSKVRLHLAEDKAVLTRHLGRREVRFTIRAYR